MAPNLFLTSDLKLELLVKSISLLLLLFLSLGNAVAGHHESDYDDPSMIEVQRVVDPYMEAFERVIQRCSPH